MQLWWEGSLAAAQLLLLMTIGWLTVFLASRAVEQRLTRKRHRAGPATLSALSWLWAYSNVIGIPTLLFGSAYLIWSMNWGGGLSSGPTALVVLLMMVAGFLIGFGPGMRR